MKPIIYLKNAWELFYDEDSHEIVFEKKDSGGNNQRKISYELPTDIWTQLSVSRKDGNLTFYVNGVSIGSPIPDDSVYENSDQLLIGKSEETHFAGFIEQLKIAKTSEYNCDFKPHDFDKFTYPQTELCLRLEDNYMNASGSADVDQVNKTDPSLISTFGNNGSDNVSLTNTHQLKDDFTIAFQLKLEQPSGPIPATILHFGDSNSQLKVLDLKTALATSGQKLVLSYIDSSESEHSFETTSFTSNGGFRSIKLIGDITSNTISIYADGVLIGSKSDYTGLIKSRGTFPDLQNILADWQYNNPQNTMTNNGGYGPTNNRINNANFTISGLKRLFLPSHSTYRVGTTPRENLFAGNNWSMYLKYHGAVQIVLHFKEPITIPKGATPFGCFNGGSGSTVGYGTNDHTPSRGVAYGNCMSGGRTYKLNPQSWISSPATQDIENVNYILSGVLAGACGDNRSCYVTRFGFDKLLFKNGKSENDDYYNLLYSELTLGHPASHNPSDWHTPSEAVSFVGELKNISITDSVLTELDCVVCDYKSIPPTPSPSPSPSATETPSPSPSPSATETPSPSPSPSRTTSYTPSPTITCGEPDYTGIESTFVCVSGLTLGFVGFDKLESQGGRPIYETPSGNARIFWHERFWVFAKCDESSLNDCTQAGWTHSIPNACDFYPWEADWVTSDEDPRILHLVNENNSSYFWYWYEGYFGEDSWHGSVDVKNCTPCDACLIEPNQYSLTELGLPAVNSLSAEWYRDFGGSLCYGLIHYTQNENFQIFKTYIAYIENDASPIGTITITGEFIGSDLITYQSPLNECYIATPTIEGSQNVYRFIKEGATPTPSDTSSPTHTPSPTFTPSPSPTITPSPSPSPSVTHTPSPTETPESELSCCTEGLIANIISKNTEIEFGSPTITATAFTFNAEVCVDVPDGGLPYSVKLKLNNAIVGVLTTTGVMTGTIYVKNTDTEVCYTGTIVNDECSLTILQ